MQKQDVGARRVGKLADMTKLHDEMKAEYITRASFFDKARPKKEALRIRQIDNVNTAIKFCKELGITFAATAENFVDGDVKMILAAIYAIIVKYIKLDEGDADSSDIKEALLLWLRNKTQGYANISVENFTKSLYDGLVFCALIHRHLRQV
eukprot:Pompholyxophrys_punicea_v1_NODE_517_length_1784_cov_123.901099.p2 type:complete len:151 gc:universal NODE_517_length_1784_cov_123.901099:970-518(-)